MKSNSIPLARFRYVASYKPNASDHEPGGGLSKTVPGLGVSLRELVLNYRLTGDIRDVPSHSGTFDTDDDDLDAVDLEKVGRMDLVDQSEVMASEIQKTQFATSVLAKAQKDRADQLTLELAEKDAEKASDVKPKPKPKKEPVGHPEVFED